MSFFKSVADGKHSKKRESDRQTDRQTDRQRETETNTHRVRQRHRDRNGERITRYHLYNNNYTKYEWINREKSYMEQETETERELQGIIYII